MTTLIRGTSQIRDRSVTAVKIAIETITNTEISPSAAIALSKLEASVIRADGTVAFTGNQSMGSHYLTNLLNPVNPQDAATKAYVDSVVLPALKYQGSVNMSADPGLPAPAPANEGWLYIVSVASPGAVSYANLPASTVYRVGDWVISHGAGTWDYVGSEDTSSSNLPFTTALRDANGDFAMRELTAGSVVLGTLFVPGAGATTVDCNLYNTVMVSSATTAVTLNLINMEAGKRITVIDTVGNASIGNITITDTIDHPAAVFEPLVIETPTTSVTIIADYGSVTYEFDGSQYNLISSVKNQLYIRGDGAAMGAGPNGGIILASSVNDLTPALHFRTTESLNLPGGTTSRFQAYPNTLGVGYQRLSVRDAALGSPSNFVALESTPYTGRFHLQRLSFSSFNGEGMPTPLANMDYSGFGGDLQVDVDWSIRGNKGLKLYDGDNSNYIRLLADASRTTDIDYVLPRSDPGAGAVLTAAAPISGSSDLSWTAVLPAVNGGTGQNAVAVGDLLYGSATNAWSRLAGNPETSIKVLAQVGDGVNPLAPFWTAPPSVSNLSYYFYNTASDVGGYLKMLATPSTGGVQNIDNASVVNGQLLASFVTEPGVPGLLFLQGGLDIFHIHAVQTGGTKTTKLYANVYKRASGGAETLINTITTSDVLTGTPTDFHDNGTIADPGIALLATDRLVIKFYADVSGGGSAPDVRLQVEGTTYSGVRFPSTTVDSSTFVPYTGATRDVDLGAFNLTANAIGVGSAANPSYDVNLLRGTFLSQVADGAGAIGLVVNTNNTFSTAGAKLQSWKNNTSEKAYVDKDGDIVIPEGGFSALVSGSNTTTPGSFQSTSSASNSYAVYASHTGATGTAVYARSDLWRAIDAQGASTGSYGVYTTTSATNSNGAALYAATLSEISTPTYIQHTLLNAVTSAKHALQVQLQKNAAGTWNGDMLRLTESGVGAPTFGGKVIRFETGSDVWWVDRTGLMLMPQIEGSTAASGTLTLISTSNATKGKILFGTSAYDEVNNRLGIANASPSYPLDVTGQARVTTQLGVGTTPNSSYDVNLGLGKLTSNVADGASAIGFILNTTNTFSTAGANLLQLQNATTAKYTIDKGGVWTLGEINLLDTSGYRVAKALSGSAAGTGDRNVFLGGYIANFITTGDYNTAVGREAGNALTSGVYNVFMGYQAAAQAQDSQYCLALGYQALYSMTTGVVANNIGIGRQAGFGVTSGYDNMFIGTSSGSGVTAGTRNVAIGVVAGGTLDGSYNISIGYNSRGSTAALNSSIAIGADAKVTASNQLVIGGDDSTYTTRIADAYIGNGVTNATPTDITINASGGSGTNVAGAVLNIAGGKATGNAAGGAINFKTSDAGGSGTTLQTLTTKVSIAAGGALSGTSSIKSTSSSAGIGYETGAGSTVTQATSKSTAVTINNICGQVTTHNANLNDATTVSFTVNNSAIAATDVIHLTMTSGGTGGGYLIWADSITASTSFKINIRNVSGGTLGEALVINYAIGRSVAA